MRLSRLSLVFLLSLTGSFSLANQCHNLYSINANSSEEIAKVIRNSGYSFEARKKAFLKFISEGESMTLDSYVSLKDHRLSLISLFSAQERQQVIAELKGWQQSADIAKRQYLLDTQKLFLLSESLVDVKLALEIGANINHVYRNGKTALFMNAEKYGSFVKEVFEFLVTHPEANLNFQEAKTGKTMLIVLTERGLLSAQAFHKLLSDERLNLNLQDINGKTALMHFLKFNTWSKEILLLFLTHPRLDLSLTDNAGNNLLMISGEISPADTFDVVLSLKKFNVNATNYAGESLVHILANNGDFVKLERLLKETDLNVNVQDKNLRTALMIAVQRDSEIFVEKLRHHGKADPNLTDINGLSPLMLLVDLKAKPYHLTATAKQLIAFTNLKADLKNLDGETALDLSKKAGNDVLTSLLVNPYEVRQKVLEDEKNMVEIEVRL